MNRIIGALAAFAASKASVLVAPLFLSTTLSLSDYGKFEFSLAAAQITSAFLALGIHGGIPYFLLKRRKPFYAVAFSLHLVVVTTICIAASVAAKAAGQASLSLAIATSGILVSQLISSARLKSIGRPMESALAEGGLYILLLVFVAGTFIGALRGDLGNLSSLLVTYLFFVLAWNLIRFPWGTPRLRLRRTYSAAIKYGVGVGAASIANVGLVSLGRLLIGVVGSFEHVGLYGLVYRLSAPLVAIHQFLATLRFTRLYVAEVKSFEIHFALLSLLLLTGAVATTLLGPIVGRQLIGGNADALAGTSGLFIIMAVVMMLWSQLSLMELFLAREKRAAMQLPGFAAAGLAVIAASLLPIWGKVDAVGTMALIQGLGLAFALLWQFRCSGVPAPRWLMARLIIIVEVVILIVSWLIAEMGSL